MTDNPEEPDDLEPDLPEDGEPDDQELDDLEALEPVDRSAPQV